MAMEMTELTYDKYRMQNVFGEKPASLRGEIAEFWLANGALQDEAAAWRRTKEVVLVIRNPEGEMVGISTVYLSDFGARGDKYYFFRMFIRPGDRVPGMMRFVTRETGEFLKARYTPGGPRGFVIITENAKLMGPGMRGMLQRAGLTDGGKTRDGADIWYADF